MPDTNAPSPPSQTVAAAAPEAGFPPGIAYVDGQYVPMSEARIPILDWGFLRSDATYDVVHVWEGRFFRLDRHLDRFHASVAKLRMTLPFDREGVAGVLAECVRRAGLRSAYVEMICTRGHSPTYSRDPRDAINRFMAFAIPFSWIATVEQRSRGLNVVIATVPRIPLESVDPTVKNYHWLDFVRGLFEGYERGGETVVLTDLAGNIAEGPGFNIFAVKAGRAYTPQSGVLHGITRMTALDLCAELGVPAESGTLDAGLLRSADEVFLTSTAGGIAPITRIDGQPVAGGQPGPITRRLTELYWEKHSDPAWTTAIESLG